MQKNLDKLSGLHNSQRVLLALTQAGVSREDSYRLVQRNAMKTWEHGADFLASLKADPRFPRAFPLRTRGDVRSWLHFKHVDTIFARVFGEA